MRQHAHERIDIYARVTARIVTDIERGVRPWQQPWRADGGRIGTCRPLRANGQPYRGINVLLLWSEMTDRGYRSPTWMTYRQASEAGGQVRKGERGTQIVYADRLTRTDTDDTGNEHERAIPFLKGYTVFNVEQIDGLPDHYQAVAEVPMVEAVNREAASFFARTRIDIRHGGNCACYSPSGDYIQLPTRDCFKDEEAYFATLAHEAVHATAHPSRVGRQLGARFGDDAYAMEELIAELGAAFLCAELGVSAQVQEEHASYLAHWLRVLKADKRAIFTAASQSQRAVDFLSAVAAAPSLEAQPILEVVSATARRVQPVGVTAHA